MIYLNIMFHTRETHVKKHGYYVVKVVCKTITTGNFRNTFLRKRYAICIPIYYLEKDLERSCLTKIKATITFSKIKDVLVYISFRKKKFFFNLNIFFLKYKNK